MQVYLLIYFEIQKFLSADNSISGLTRSLSYKGSVSSQSFVYLSHRLNKVENTQKS